MDSISDRIDEMAIEAALAGNTERALQLADASLEFYKFSETELCELKMYFGDDYEAIFCAKSNLQ